MTSIHIRERALVYMILAEQKPISEKSILPYGVGLRRQNVGISGSSIVYHHSLAKYGYEMEDVCPIQSSTAGKTESWATLLLRTVGWSNKYTFQ